MSELLREHKNYIVFKYFQEIAAIPHGSGNTRAIRNYIVDLAKKHNLDHTMDPTGNIIIMRDAAPGYENSAPVMLQGHVDMVCEKESGSKHDFNLDPLSLYVEDGFLKAKETTLGGDDGIGVSYMLALLTKEDYQGPRIECVFTVDEETGMDGAHGLDLSKCRADYLINLDSEKEGTFVTGCAGGSRIRAVLPIKTRIMRGYQADITISGLKGGHSGDEIDKGRANAIQLMSRFLFHLLRSKATFGLLSIDGGDKDNAIPREASASIVITSSPARLCDLADTFRRFVSDEFAATDPDIQITIYEAQRETEHFAITEECQNSIYLMTYAIPNGVIAMSQSIPGIPETSTNLGIVRSTGSNIECSYLLRSSFASRKRELIQRMTLILKSAGAQVTYGHSYPAWEYKPESGFRKKLSKLWEKMYGSAPEVTAIHGGLECGIISSKKESLDIVSMGPDILDIHTPKERLDIESASRVYDFLVEFLKEKG
ncbi:MAG: aminoacyl-histidine dipeptidase [Lachnospiraceae bacterium]|nr:aminoacyl-histidine dipeptidase [Lachnospiraceae bacterium]MBR4808158.1 aminoacyl-histidine dipeptidase [Lachnospiraceae bacterium]